MVEEKTTVRISKETWKRLSAEKMMTNANSIEDVIKSMINRRRKKDVYGMLGI